MTCELCGQPRIVYRTLLRAPWSDEIVSVRACTECGSRAWRTVTEPRRERVWFPPPTQMELDLAEARP